MRLNVKDGEGEPQTIVVNGVAAVTDRSTVIEEADEAQELMAANDERGGYFLQNLGTVPLMVCELGVDAEVTNSFQIMPLGTWPPAFYPVTVAAISIKSAEADAIVIAREW